MKMARPVTTIPLSKNTQNKNKTHKKMAKVSFGPDSLKVAAPAAAIPQAPVTAVATVPKIQPPSTFVGSEESIDFRDIVIPRLNMVQKVGPLSEQFTPGLLVLDQELVLPQPLDAVLLGFRPTRYVERVPGGALGNICNSEAEVVEAGGTLDFKEAQSTDKPWYQYEATAILLIKKPDAVTDDSKFPFEFDGKKWGLFTWSMKGSAYTHAVKPLKTARRIGYLRANLGKEYYSFTFKITVDLEKFRTGNAAYVPVFEKGDETSKEFIKFIKAILSGEAA